MFEDKHYFCCDPVGFENTLSFLGNVLSDGGYKSVQKQPCKDFTCNGESGNFHVPRAV